MTEENSIANFLKKYGKEILDKERYKYEPIKQESKMDQTGKRDVIIEKSEYTELLILKLEKQSHEIEELKKENIKLIKNSNKEWIDKYKKYKHSYYDTKKELKDTKLELKQMKQEMDNLKLELENLQKSMKKLKGKNKKSDTSSEETWSDDSRKEIESNKDLKIVGYIEGLMDEEEDNDSELIRENDQIIEVLRKMKSVNAVIEEEPTSDIEEEFNKNNVETEAETEDIINEDANDYPEEELVDPNLELISKRKTRLPDHIPIGQQSEFKEFVGSMSQGINLNGYFLDLDNVYDEQEINRRIHDWNLGMFIALMNSNYTSNLDYVYDLISKTLIGKVGFWFETITVQFRAQAPSYATDWKSMLSIFDIVLKREFLGERWFVSQEKVIAERKTEIIMNLNNMKCCKISKLPEYTISFSKFFYEARFSQEEGITYQQLYYDHLPTPYNIEITKEYNQYEPKENTLGERIRVLRSYLMRKCEEYRVQQKIKKDKRKGLREICGFTEKRLIFGCDRDYNDKRRKRRYPKRYKQYRKNRNNESYYKPYYRPYKRYKRKKFRRYRNTPETRRRFRNKRKFRKRRRNIRPLEGENKNKKPYECRCWNCNEKGHYANKCPKLKQKGVKYINTTEFIMNLEQIQEENDQWYEYEVFYISETEPEEEEEEIIESEEESSE